MNSNNVFNVRRQGSSMSTAASETGEITNDGMTSNNQQRNVRVMVQFQDTKLTRRSERPSANKQNTKFKRQYISGNRYSNTVTTKYVVPIYVVLLLGTMTAGVALIVLQKFVSGSTLLSITAVLILIGMAICCTNTIKTREAEKRKMFDQIEMSHQASHEETKKPPPPDPIMMRGITSFAFHGQGECEACLFHRKCEEARISGHPEFIPPSIRPNELTSDVRNRKYPSSNGYVPNKEYLNEQRRQSCTDDFVRKKFLENENMKNFVSEFIEDDRIEKKKPRRRKLPQQPDTMDSYRRLSFSADDVPLVGDVYKNERSNHKSSYEISPPDNSGHHGYKDRATEGRDYYYANVATVADVHDQLNRSSKSSKRNGAVVVAGNKRNHLKIPEKNKERNTSSSNSIEVIMDLTDTEDENRKSTIVEDEYTHKLHRGNNSNNNHQKMAKESYFRENHTPLNDCGPKFSSDMNCFT